MTILFQYMIIRSVFEIQINAIRNRILSFHENKLKKSYYVILDLKYNIQC